MQVSTAPCVQGELCVQSRSVCSHRGRVMNAHLTPGGAPSLVLHLVAKRFRLLLLPC